MVTMVEQASATKAKTQLFIEKVEQRYSAGVVLSTLVVFLLPLALGQALRPALLRAMTFMIVASPCAVVLATMPPLLSAIANAGRHGVLVKSAVVMEQLGAITKVAFDKTGTLTQGTPRFADVLTLPGTVDDELLALAAAAELPSEHPLGRRPTSTARVPAPSPPRHLPPRRPYRTYRESAFPGSGAPPGTIELLRGATGVDGGATGGERPQQGGPALKQVLLLVLLWLRGDRRLATTAAGARLAGGLRRGGGRTRQGFGLVVGELPAPGPESGWRGWGQQAAGSRSHPGTAPPEVGA